MSTIRKLDPTHRADAARRRLVVGELARMAQDTRMPRNDRLIAGATAAELEAVRRNPALDGSTKEHRFKRILRRPRVPGLAPA